MPTPSPDKIPLNVRITPRLHADLSAIAEAREQRLSDVVRSALEAWVIDALPSSVAHLEQSALAAEALARLRRGRERHYLEAATKEQAEAWFAV